MLYTVGYERRDLDELIELLEQHRVEQLIDVRFNASSRKPGYAKSRLSQALATAGIGYRHLSALGNPRENREPLRRGEPDAIAAYRARLDEAPDAVEVVARAAADHDVALLCYERDPSGCHRALVADAVVQLAPSVNLHHLR
ncbi:MAG: DUF488 family protein [Nitriliruptoraceae bacterium]